jgi:hypothetical protein
MGVNRVTVSDVLHFEESNPSAMYAPYTIFAVRQQPASVGISVNLYRRPARRIAP